MNKKTIYFLSVALASLSASINQFSFIWAASRFGAAVLGASFLAGMLPQLLLMSFSGIMADRLEPIRLLSLSAWLRATVLLFMIIAFSWQASAFVFIAGNFIFSIVGYLFSGSAVILISTLFKEEELIRANASTALISGLAFVIGPLFAAWIYDSSGLRLALFIDALLLASSGLLLLFLPRIARKGSTESLDLSFALAGIKYLKNRPKVVRLVVFFAITNIFMAALQVSMPIYAETIGGVGSFALLSSSMNIAALLANFALATLPIKSSEAIIYSTSAVEGLALFALASFRKLPAAMAFVGLNDAMATINGSLFISWLQKTVDNEVLGRVYSVISSLALILTPLAFALTPILITSFGVLSVLYILAILTFIISMAFFLWSKLNL